MKKYLIHQLLNVFQVHYNKNIQSFASLRKLLQMSEPQILRLINIYSNI